MKTMISNLYIDLLEEILSRVPVKSIGTVRSTCKNWNVLTKDQRFANKHIEKAAAASQLEKEVLVITGDPYYDLINVKFYDFHNKTFDPSTKSNCILITQQNLDSVVFVHSVFYCNGLLLCLLGNLKLRLLVWNPYWGKTRWINCPTKQRWYEMFAFGYNKSCGTHKILRLSSHDNIFIHINMYDLSSDSWKTPDEAFNSNVIEYTKPGLSLKGNTYWYAYDKESRDGNVSLSSVKEEKLALLKYLCGSEVTVWVTDKIEPDDVLWSKLFKVETLLFNRGYLFESLLIDEENKTVVAFDDYDTCCNTNAYIIDGESGNFRKVDLIESPYSRLYNLVTNYVPSSVHI
ncbi:hypothetical protein Bca101_083495 [Brassica carinata]